jgi:hypothetical protein
MIAQLRVGECLSKLVPIEERALDSPEDRVGEPLHCVRDMAAPERDLERRR